LRGEQARPRGGPAGRAPGPPPGRARAALAERAAGARREGAPRNVAQRTAPPQPERLLETTRGDRCLPPSQCAPTLADQALESECVNGLRRQIKAIASRSRPNDDSSWEGTPEP